MSVRETVGAGATGVAGAAGAAGADRAQALAGELRERLQAWSAPLAARLDAKLDARLVRTLERTLAAILTFRNRAYGLLLSELGAYLLDPEHAPAGTKRLSNLLRSQRWSAREVDDFLFEQAQQRLVRLEQQEEPALLVWDQSVIEKTESRKAEGLCSVRSSKAARHLKVKPGFYRPPTHKPVFVPGLHWISLLLVGLHGVPAVVRMQWLSTRSVSGKHASDLRQAQTELLIDIARAWGRRVLHLFDRGYAGSPWLGALLGFELRFVSRWPKRYHLYAWLSGEGRSDARSQSAWKLARGKRAQDSRWVRDARTGQERKLGVLAIEIRHPDYRSTPLFLVVCRTGKGREPWYLLTNEPIHTADDAWRIVFAYVRRWQIEMAFRYGKSELAMESPRLWTWEGRLKLLALVTLAYGFLLSLLDPLLEWLRSELLDRFCHRTGKRSRQTTAPLYRLRAALSYLWTAFPLPLQLSGKGNPG